MRLRWLEKHRTGNPGVILSTDKYFYFRDTGMYIYSSADGVLDMLSDTTLNITGTTALNLSGVTITIAATTLNLTGTINVGSGTGMWADYPLQNTMDPSLYHILFDDFLEFTEAAIWTTTEDASKTGTDALMDVVGGVYTNFCDGDDNDESYCISTAETFLIATGKKMWFQARLRVDEAATDDANVIVGLMDVAGADALLDNAGGPAASYDGAVFCKVDGGTKWQFETSNAGTQETTAEVAAYADDTFIELGFYYDGVTSITPYVDGTAGTAHTIAVAGLEEMHVLFGIKAGSAVEEAIEIDYIKCVQLR